MENGFVGQRAFMCSMAVRLWEMEGSRFSWLYVSLLPVHETVAMTFHHPKQGKIVILVAEVSVLPLPL